MNSAAGCRLGYGPVQGRVGPGFAVNNLARRAAGRGKGLGRADGLPSAALPHSSSLLTAAAEVAALRGRETVGPN